jgi:hypothetical protein
MRWARWGACIPALCFGAVAWGQAPPIYSCVDSNGKKLTSDRPILECNSREQRVLNSDGSVKRVVPPPPTEEESAAAEKRERDAAAERATRMDAMHRDRNLLARYPNEAAHNKARQSALEDIRKSMRLSEARLVDLANERKPLMDESEFYVGKPLPGKLKMRTVLRRGTQPAAQPLGRRAARIDGHAAGCGVRAAPIAHGASLRLSRSCTWVGLPLPFVAFIAWPTSALNALSLPLRYSSTDFGLAASTSSTMRSRAPASLS